MIEKNLINSFEKEKIRIEQTNIECKSLIDGFAQTMKGTSIRQEESGQKQIRRNAFIKIVKFIIVILFLYASSSIYRTNQKNLSVKVGVDIEKIEKKPNSALISNNKQIDSSIDEFDSSVWDIPLPKYVIQKKRQQSLPKKTKTNKKYQRSKSEFPFVPIQSQLIQFCIVSPSTATQSQIQEHIDMISKQTLKQWRLVAFMNSKYFQQERKSQKNKIRLIESHHNQGKNIYDAINNYCKAKSFVLLLNVGEVLTNVYLLQKMAGYFNQFDRIYAFAFPFKSGNQLAKPNEKMNTFARHNYIGSNEDMALMSNIVNSFKIFQSDLYRLIPRRQLHDIDNVFYESRLSFLLPLLQMGRSAQMMREVVLEIEKSIYYPLDFIFFDEPIITGSKIQLKKDMSVVLAKPSYEPLGLVCINAHVKGIDLNKLLEIREKKSIIGKKRSITEPIIPNIIHQIWIKGVMPPSKVYITKHNRQLHPDFQYRLWTSEDITAQNFPITISYLQKLLELDKTAEFSRMAMLSDIMRNQIIYKHGGFYIDTNYMLLKSCLQTFRYFKLFLPGSEASYNGIHLNNGFFGAPKESQYLSKLLKPSILASFDLNNQKTHFVTGPFFFRRIITSQDELDLDILIPPFEQIYPYYEWMEDQRWHKDRCAFKKNVVIPQKVLARHKVDATFQDITFLDKCAAQYPNSYGTDFFELGGTWVDKRTKQSDPHKI